MVEVVRTHLFSVFSSDNAQSAQDHERKEPEGVNASANSLAVQKQAKYLLERNGYVILDDVFDNAVEQFKDARKAIASFFRKELLPCYEFASDSFEGFDQDEHAITRMPRIGDGKHNIHFDPEFSEEHRVLSKLISTSCILQVLSRYMGSTASLRECGISATRPRDPSKPVSYDGSQIRRFGEGMQWHSDGADGEATILLSLDGIDEDMGVLKMVPRSYMEYVDGVGYDEAIVEERIEELERRAVHYCYRKGCPMVFDARTMHGVENNVSDRWRVVCWFIVDCY